MKSQKCVGKKHEEIGVKLLSSAFVAVLHLVLELFCVVVCVQLIDICPPLAIYIYCTRTVYVFVGWSSYLSDSRERFTCLWAGLVLILSHLHLVC